MACARERQWWLEVVPVGPPEKHSIRLHCSTGDLSDSLGFRASKLDEGPIHVAARQ
jgi:hypothetical protein